MYIILKYILWIVSTTIAFIGAWFFKFTCKHPVNQQQLVLTKAGKWTLPIAVLAFVGAFCLQIVEQRNSAEKAKELEKEKKALSQELKDIKNSVGQIKKNLASLIKKSPDLEKAIMSDSPTATGLNDFYEAVDKMNRLKSGNVITTPLFSAVQQGNKNSVTTILESGANPDEVGDNGIQPLVQAASKDDINIAKMLLDKGANINARTLQLGNTALMRATETNHKEMVQYLIDRKADVNIADNSGCTALGKAAQLGHHEIFKMLLRCNAEPNVVSKSGNTPLKEAAIQGWKDNVVALLNAGADPNLGNTAINAIMYSSECPPDDRLEIIKLLVRNGGKCNLVDDKKFTPLVFAVQNNCASYVPLLAKCGANVNYRFKDSNKTLLGKAIEWNFAEVAEALRKEGAR
ncbi:MAG: hypothetical protein A2511_03120 [Deltaproteobacteria bacterium RIFOXYD12_FULL_50_9]|nr:MAG: hypothetical protein A2511_03120 [Deltaproteobacteria bacterium RIFOXYD12_FULL_50_9]